ncbi:hypothetical protein M8C13_25735 [Crossiella sp. SN42]|uniref:hypothetical protein n=1 Tax=Crossiella sp. SN42 TaxID=2944808 RepID=UPI00207D1C59|nr:hypothetical protein [Crossiella sp. SN42]MCO1579156.1 hypothetical protein [Crossiella sp. SN42]
MATHQNTAIVFTAYDFPAHLIAACRIARWHGYTVTDTFIATIPRNLLSEKLIDAVYTADPVHDPNTQHRINRLRHQFTALGVEWVDVSDHMRLDGNALILHTEPIPEDQYPSPPTTTKGTMS